jgi:cephalosporin hydroxylase
VSKAEVFSLAERFLRYAIEKGASDSQQGHADLAAELGISPKLLQFNPELHRALNGTADTSNLSKVLDWTIRDWLNYHHQFIEQGYRYGLPQLQQEWMGRPILKTPFDCWIYQEIIHRVKPDVIVELGVKFGGSALYLANLMDIMGHGELIGVDVDLSNVQDLEHSRITFLEGSSTAQEIVADVHARVGGGRAIVIADSNHERTHVLGELDAYNDLVPKNSYFIVEDGIGELMDWMPVPIDGALAASTEFLASHPEFEADREIAEKYLITSNPDGFLLRVGE